MTDNAEFRVRINSPIGKNSIDQFQHYLSKIADESEQRFGIEITVERVDQ